MRFKSNASTRTYVRVWRSEHDTERCHCYGPSNVWRLCCPREPNKSELGTCLTTVSSALSKATAFRSWGFPAYWSPYPFENMVTSDHTFVKKNKVVWHWGTCHLRSCHLFNVHVHDHTFDQLTITYVHTYVLPHAGRGYNNANLLSAHCLLGA